VSKHHSRHARAYAAGARDACERIKETVSAILPQQSRPEFDRIVDNIKTTQFPMPEPNGKISK
jgi:hypothetical protein